MSDGIANVQRTAIFPGLLGAIARIAALIPLLPHRHDETHGEIVAIEGVGNPAIVEGHARPASPADCEKYHLLDV